MNVPYSLIIDGMDMASYMYICRTQSGTYYEYVKCQMLKLYILINNTMAQYHDEKPDLTKNPFTRTTRIDCNKLFSTYTVTYDVQMKITNRLDVCDDLFSKMEQELLTYGYQDININ